MTTSENIKSEIVQILDNASGAGNIAVGELCPSLPPLAGIFIVGYGPVAVPVSAETVINLKKHFEQAPDSLEENSWQIGVDKFKIDNSEFSKKVEELLPKVQKRLGCEEVSVSCQLSKLVLYGPGAGSYIKSHRDTEKDDDVLATLVVQLPSVATGGDLVVTHNDQRDTVELCQEGSAYGCVYAAHYAECEVELTRVTAGYRLALIYTLVRRGEGNLPSVSQLKTPLHLVKLLHLYTKENSSRPLVWLLDHLYSQNSLEEFNIDALEGKDREVMYSVMKVNKAMGINDNFELSFINASKEDIEYGECNEWESRRYSSSYGRGKSSDCFELNGCDDQNLHIEGSFPVGEKVIDPKFSAEFILENVINKTMDDGDDFWGEGKAGECIPGGYEEGATRSKWYHRSFLVMWKKKDAALIGYANDFTGSIKHIESLLQLSMGLDQVKEELDCFLPYCQNNEMLVLNTETMKERKCPIMTILKIVTGLDEPSYLKKTLNLMAGSLLNEEIILNIQIAVEKFSWEILQPEIEAIFQKIPQTDFGLSGLIKCLALKDNSPTDLKKSLFQEMKKRCVKINIVDLNKYFSERSSFKSTIWPRHRDKEEKQERNVVLEIWKAIISFGKDDCNILLNKLLDAITTSMDLKTVLEKMENTFSVHTSVRNDIFFKGIIQKYLNFSKIGKDHTIFSMKSLAFLSLSCRDGASLVLLLEEFKRRIYQGNFDQMDYSLVILLQKVLGKFEPDFKTDKLSKEEMIKMIVDQMRIPETIIKVMNQLQHQSQNSFFKELCKQFLLLVDSMKIISSDILAFVKLMKKVNAEEFVQILVAKMQKAPYVNCLEEYLSKMLDDSDEKAIYTYLVPLIHTRLSQLAPEVATGKPTFTWHMPDAVTNHPELANFLHGPEETHNLTGFDSIKRARRWKDDEANKYKKFITTSPAQGTGRRAYVPLRKIHEMSFAQKKYNDQVKEIAKLKSHLLKGENIIKLHKKEGLANPNGTNQDKLVPSNCSVTSGIERSDYNSNKPISTANRDITSYPEKKRKMHPGENGTSDWNLPTKAARVEPGPSGPPQHQGELNNSGIAAISLEDLEEFSKMFPAIEKSVIQAVYFENRGDKEATVNSLLVS